MSRRYLYAHGLLERAAHDPRLRKFPHMLSEPGSGEVRGLLQRLGGPGAGFVTDLVADAALNRPVMVDAAAATAAIHPYTWLLGRVGDRGIRLTRAGYLPTAVVAEAVAVLRLGGDDADGRHREQQTPALLELRDSARRMALIRVQHGVLRRTALGARLSREPGRLWWHVASRLPEGRAEAERDAGLLLLLAVASAMPLDAQVANDHLRRGMAALGWEDTRTGQPLDEGQVFEAARATWGCLRRLGVIPDQRNSRGPAAPHPAAVSFARAALRGPAW